MIYTKDELLEFEVDIWAVPKYKPEPGEFPFRYQVYDTEHKPYQKGSVKVTRKGVYEVRVPEGINLYEKAIETLEAGKQEIYDYAAQQVKELQEQIDSLKLLAAPKETPSNDDIEGEVV